MSEAHSQRERPSVPEPPAITLSANRRLAEQLEVEQVSASAFPLERPPVYTASAWLVREWTAVRDRLALKGEKTLPLPVPEELRLVLWEQAAALALAELAPADGAEAAAAGRLLLAGPQRLAQGMARAYALAGEYGLAADAIEAEAEALAGPRLFARALSAYRKSLTERDWLDPADLPLALAEQVRVGQVPAPAALRLLGFRELSPALRVLIEACRQRGTKVEECPLPTASAPAALHRLPDPRLELRAAARWAKERVEGDPEARVAVVVSDLHARRREVLSLFDEVFAPDRQPGGPRPYGVSLGTALADAFPERDALAWLRWLLSENGLPPAQARACLLSPAWTPPEGLAPAMGEWRRREGLPPRVRPEHVGLTSLEDEAASLRSLRLDPARWVERFRSLLERIGFPGPSPLDSAAYQALDRFEEMLHRFATLRAVLGEIGAGEALARFEGLCRRRLFQPQGPISRLQVLGPLEAVGLCFDHALVVGLNEGRFPPPREPDPFLPLALQRKHRMPGTDPDLDAAHDRRWFEALLGMASRVELSFAEQEEDRPLLPSWLINGLEASPGAAKRAAPSWLHIFEARSCTEVEDQPRRPLAAGTVLAGGAQRFREHLQCPFRGFALGELGAGRPADPKPPPDAKEMGLIVHAILARLAREGRLAEAEAARWEAVAEEEVTGCFAGRARSLDEQQRAVVAREIARRIARLVAAERQRSPGWRIRAVEGQLLEEGFLPPFELELAGLQLKLRCDRIDAVPDGALAVIDYKTGEAQGPGQGETLGDPQLALYALLDERIQAVVHARLDGRDEGPVFSGIAAARGWFPNDRIGPPKDASESWFSELRARWRQELEEVAKAIREGLFPAAPRPGVCRRCELAALCRIRERKEAAAALDEEDGETA